MRLAEVLRTPRLTLPMFAEVYGLDVLVEACDGDAETPRWRLTYASPAGPTRVIVGDSGATFTQPGVGRGLARFINLCLFGVGLPNAVRVFQVVLDDLGDAARLAPELADLAGAVDRLRPLAGAGREPLFTAALLPDGPERMVPWVDFARRWGISAELVEGALVSDCKLLPVVAGTTQPTERS